MSDKAYSVRIAIIDSGVDDICNYEGLSIVPNGDNDGFQLLSDFQDHTGHGTVVTNIIKTFVPDASLFILKLFDDEIEEITTEKLIYGLKYLLENVKPDIIHLSLGVSFCDQIFELRGICKELCDNGCVIISSYDNNGALSYPAAFPFVIGVDSNSQCVKRNEFYYIKNSPINISAIGTAQRLKGIGAKYIDVFGSSFSAPYITGIIANMFIYRGGRIPLDELHIMLMNKSIKVLEAAEPLPVKLPFDINKAIMFPYNKEISTMLLHYNDIIPTIVGVYDIKYLKNIGKSVNREPEILIQNVDHINWEDDFDTVILGHLDEINKLSRFNYSNYIVKKCAEYGKKIYSFDDVSVYSEKFGAVACYTPQITQDNIPNNYNGKLRQIGKPILCIAGTSPRQGKYSLQLDIKRLLRKRGINVGLLATEPSGYLLGADMVFPMGYNSTVKVDNGIEMIAAVNHVLGAIEDINPDIIITGLQSQTIPMQVCNVRDMALTNHFFLLGVNPDAVILVVNIFDDIDYIRRTIRYLESIVISDVIGIAIFPILKTVKWNTLGTLSVRADIDDLLNFKKILKDEFSISVFILDDEDEKSGMAEEIIEYFT